MTALDSFIDRMENTHQDLKVLYTLWLGMLTIEVLDKRTGKPHMRTFAGLDSNVEHWFDDLQKGV